MIRHKAVRARGIRLPETLSFTACRKGTQRRVSIQAGLGVTVLYDVGFVNREEKTSSFFIGATSFLSFHGRAMLYSHPLDHSALPNSIRYEKSTTAVEAS